MNLVLLVGAGGVVGFLSGLFGVGGGFLLTPILMMIGIPATVAAASDTCQIVAASSSGVGAHFRLGNVDFKLGGVLLVGGLAGAAVGVQIIKILRALGNADLVISLTYVVMLGAIGLYMVIDSARQMRRGVAEAVKPHRPGRKRPLLGRLPWRMSFPRSGIEHSVLLPLLLAVVVGILAAIMGVGGGFIMVPIMVYVLGMSAHIAVGTSLFQILLTCAGTTYMQAATNHTVDLVLALLLATGSALGAQVGAQVGRYLHGNQLLILLGGLALLVAIKMMIGLVVAPEVLLVAPRVH